jgi:hypothetical protein
MEDDMEAALNQLLFVWGIIVIAALVIVIIALIVYIHTLTKNYFEVIREKDAMRDKHNREIRQIRDEEKGFTE